MVNGVLKKHEKQKIITIQNCLINNKVGLLKSTKKFALNRIQMKI